MTKQIKRDLKFKMKQTVFSDLNFNKIASDRDFKEDSVREVIISPILKKLGYAQENIVRSRTLQHPFLKVGSKKRAVNLIPDYVLKVGNNCAWVLDAKAPDQKVINSDNVEQVYSYAAHREISSIYFALCNGLEFSVFRTSFSTDGKPVLYFKLENIDENWEKLITLLSPASFQTGKRFYYEPRETTGLYENQFDYVNRLLLEEIPVKKQAAKRHFGVHGYFTRQSWNIVAEYIKNYSKPGDLVLDPFGGSGVTAVEALMNGRKAINIDLNPMAIFLVKSLLMTTIVRQSDLAQAFEEVKDEYVKKEPKTKEEIEKALKKYPGPKKLALPKGSDVDTVDKLFSDIQMVQLALLKSIIKKQKNENIKSSKICCSVV
ncbi:hypothetical protein AGMMS49929_00710 [Endomicrobiia bacterium]|nr:hypothetical protein AGMMS49929_00710 [Endomicrobiia bacterium]